MSPDHIYIRRPRVTIGVPVYNGEAFIEEALESLLSQTFTNFELVISDNASTDDTSRICQEYAKRESRIRYVRQTKNLGAAANFLFLAREARGKHFMWAAVDDRWDSGWLAALEQQFQPGVSIAFGSIVGFQDGSPTVWRRTLKPLTGPRSLRMPRFFLWNNATTAKSFSIYGLYRTPEIQAVAEEILQKDGEHWGFDNILVFTMLRFGGMSIAPEVVFYKRVRPVVGIELISEGMFLKLQKLGPYIMEHIRRSPPGLTRMAVIAAAPLKYGWLLWRGFRRVVILLANLLSRKKLVVGKI